MVRISIANPFNKNHKIGTFLLRIQRELEPSRKKARGSKRRFCFVSDLKNAVRLSPLPFGIWRIGIALLIMTGCSMACRRHAIAVSTQWHTIRHTLCTLYDVPHTTASMQRSAYNQTQQHNVPRLMFDVMMITSASFKCAFTTASRAALSSRIPTH